MSIYMHATYRHADDQGPPSETPASKAPRRGAIQLFHSERTRLAADLMLEGISSDTLFTNPASKEAWAETRKQWRLLSAADRHEYAEQARLERGLVL